MLKIGMKQETWCITDGIFENHEGHNLPYFQLCVSIIDDHTVISHAVFGLKLII